MFKMYRMFIITMFVSTDGLSRTEGLSKQPVENGDRWEWGYVDIPIKQASIPQNNNNQPQNRMSARLTNQNTSPTQSTTEPITTREPPPIFCQTYNETKPNFKIPGRKISEAKCYDYIWELNVRLELDRRLLQCIDYQAKKYHTYAAIGGHPTTPGDYPHMGALGWKASVGTWVFKCGSSLISEKFVLTAAHCARASSRDSSISDIVPKIVRLGDKNIIDVTYNFLPPTDVNISRIIVHPNYSPPKKYFDIALMELERKVEFSRLIQPACLWNKFSTSELGNEPTLTGWGVVETGSLNISPELQAATVDLIDSQQCNALLKSSCNRNWCGIQDHQICAGKLKGGVDACQGDSGGPLQVKIPQRSTSQGQMHYVFGVISFGVGCAHPNLPGIYTRVSSFIDWIENIVWEGETI